MTEPKKIGKELGIIRDEKGRFVVGHPPTSPGRPKGRISIRDYIRRYYEKHPKEFEDLCKYYMVDPKMRTLLWQMLDGLPKQSLEYSFDDVITNVKIEINAVEPKGNNSISKKLGGVPKKD